MLDFILNILATPAMLVGLLAMVGLILHSIDLYFCLCASTILSL